MDLDINTLETGLIDSSTRNTRHEWAEEREMLDKETIVSKSLYSRIDSSGQPFSNDHTLFCL